MSISNPLDPGFSVAPGDPGSLTSAAAWHQDLADSLELHEATIRGAASTVMSTWNGEAATAYGSLSQLVAGRFAFAALVSRDAARTLHAYAAELERCQREGTQALHEAEHWLTEQNTWQSRLDDANRRIGDAQGKIADAQATLTNPLMTGPFSSAFTGPARAQLAAAERELTQAQSDARTATRELRHAEEEVIRYQQRGRQAWDEAITAAQRATGAIGAVEIPPPPLAGFAAPDRVPLSGVQHHGGGFFSDPLGTIEHLGDGALHDLGWAWNHAPGAFAAAGTVLLRGASTVISSTLPGQLLRLGSQLTGSTLGLCAGGDATAPDGLSVSGSLCYVAAPDATGGLTVTGGGGVGGPGPGLSGALGPLYSNGPTLAAQGNGFDYVSGSAGEEALSGGATVSWGSYRGHRVIDVNPVWVPRASPAGVSLHAGASYTWTFSSYSSP